MKAEIKQNRKFHGNWQRKQKRKKEKKKAIKNRVGSFIYALDDRISSKTWWGTWGLIIGLIDTSGQNVCFKIQRLLIVYFRVQYII